MLLLAGCKSLLPGSATGDRSDRPVVPKPTDISFAQLAQRYNARFEHFDRLRASLTVSYTNRDEEGKEHHVQANGQLAVRLPDRLMCRITHIGRAGTIMWAGSNRQRYWLYDASDETAARVYHGSHARYRPDLHGVAWPLHPLDLPWLMGLVPLEPAREEPAPRVDHDDEGRYVVRLARSPVRLFIDARSYEPVRIEVFDDEGQVALVSRLSKPKRVELERQPPGRWPYVATRVEIRRPERQEQLRMTLSVPRDTDIKDRWFDLDLLMNKVFKLPEDRRVDLDRRREAPPLPTISTGAPE
ncbi:MAG: hypothetical protein CMJ18_09030 [Phycisphaeraceae bacterium]|nr:hypothetical protein [Phycisphaeraceae bacterium]